MFGDQRPAAPWSFNNWWGQYDSYGDLPNVAGSSLQLPNNVQAGDIAWVRGNASLFVCQDPTQGAAVWASLPAAPQVPVEVDIYVAADAAGASDTNAGTIAAPLATINEAVLRMNDMVRAGGLIVRIHLATAVAGYTLSVLVGPAQGGAAAIIGDGAGQPGDTGFTSLRGPSAAAAGSGQTVIVDPTGGMTVNAFQGKTIIMRSGAAAGQRRTIRNNTATNIVPVFPFSAAVAVADSFEIVEPSVVVTVSPPSDPATLLSRQTCIIQGFGNPADIVGVSNDTRDVWNRSMLLLANLICANAGNAVNQPLFGVSNSAVALAGVEFRSTNSLTLGLVGADITSQLLAGADQTLGTLTEFVLPYYLGLATSAQEWSGWGTSVLQTPQPIVFNPINFRGFLVWSGDFGGFGLVPRNVLWSLYGGELNCTGAVASNAAFQVSDLSRILIKGMATTNAFRVIAIGSNNNSVAMEVVGQSTVAMINAEVRITGSGVALAASGAQGSGEAWKAGGTIALTSGITLEAPRACVVAAYGGRVYWDANPTVAVVPSLAEAAVVQSAIGGAAVVSTTFAGLADGAVAANPDLSGTLLGKIT